MDVRRLGTALAACLALTVPLLGAPTPAAAQDGSVAGSTAPIPAEPDYLPPTPDDFSVSAAEAVEIANADPKVAEQSARYGELTTAISVNDDNLWQVGYKDGDNEVAQVKIDGGTGAITESWTGYQVAWPMARGYEAQFGHILNAPWVWIPMALVFLAGLFDFRRPGRIAHLDLLVLLSFGISQAFFNGGEIGVSVPLVYPALVYLLARVLWIGFRGGGGLRPSLPVRWLGLAAILLIAFRITINIADSGVIDVGYAGTIGADRITHADPLWGEGVFPDDNRFGDTYGPANYYAYVPFELAFPWSGEWDELVPSHAAALAFDLATIAGLFFCATRLVGGRAGRDLGVLCAFAWVAYPYTAFALQSNSNDTLVAALVVWSLALFARPLARGALLAAATMVKFAPLALVPLYAAGFRGLLGGDCGGPQAGAAAPGGHVLARLRRRGGAAACLSGARFGPRDVLRPHRGQPARPDLAVQHLGPGRRDPVAADGDPRGDRRARRAARLRPAAPRPSPGRRADRRGADRAAALGRPLVLPLHPVVLRRADDCVALPARF